MPEYRVLAGTHRTEDGEVAEPGDTVELDEATRNDFAPSKFERVESGDEDEDAGDDSETTVSEETADTDEQTEPESAEDTDALISEDNPPNGTDVEDIIPYDEYRMLSSMAAEYDGDEVHGAMSGDDISDFLETLTVPEVQELKRHAEANLTE